MFGTVLFTVNGIGLGASLAMFAWTRLYKTSVIVSAHALLICTLIATLGELLIMEFIFIPTLRLVGCTTCFGDPSIASKVFPLMISIMLNNFLQFYMDLYGYGDYETMKIAGSHPAKALFSFIIIVDILNTFWNMMALSIAFSRN